MIPFSFSFQIGNTATGCEDAPPIVNQSYAAVCDGLGGAGHTKHLICENGKEHAYTSAYIGARIVAKTVDTYYLVNNDRIREMMNRGSQEDLTDFVNGLKKQINQELQATAEKHHITPSKSLAIRTFPTTLASVLYFCDNDTYKILAVWAGDSRVYALSPSKGLCLLSKDDTPEPSAMTTDSKITNKISLGLPFKINYALYTFHEPVILFACSDGCFDTVPSPLNYEWVLLRTLLDLEEDKEMPPETTLSKSFAAIYEKVIDDTTMAAIALGFDSISQIKAAFQERMNQFEPDALQIHNALKRRQNLQQDKTRIIRKQNINLESCSDIVKNAVMNCLIGDPACPDLISMIESLPSYQAFTACKNNIDEFEKQYIEIESLKKQCHHMLVIDYVKFETLKKKQLSGRKKKKYKCVQMYYRPEKSLRLISTCIAALRHPDFKLFLDDMGADLDQIVLQLEALETIIARKDILFSDLWAQAYFSTKYHTKARLKVVNSSQFKALRETAMKHPEHLAFVSKLTMQKIMLYQNRLDKIQTAETLNKTKQAEKIRCLAEEFWNKNSTTIVQKITQLDQDKILSIFGTDSIIFSQDYINNARELAAIEDQITAVSTEIDEIWARYQKQFLIYDHTSLRGESSGD